MSSNTGKTLAAVYALAASLCEHQAVWGVGNAVSRAARLMGLSMRYTEHDARMQPLRDLCAEHGSISEAVHNGTANEEEVVDRRVMLLSLAAAMATPTPEDLAAAEKLRGLARSIERGSLQFIARWVVKDEDLFARLGWLNDVDPGDGLVFSEKDGDGANVRVLFLCFAAAMLETGDL